ncbi:MAG: hypothetical protein RL337_1217 [Bacteroidota bacterium]|jgi:hypothetical protein
MLKLRRGLRYFTEATSKKQVRTITGVACNTLKGILLAYYHYSYH